MEILEGRVEIDDVDAFLDRLDEISTQSEATIQAFDARYVAGRHHLERAVELADRALERGENVARDRAVEILLYAAGRRQIDRALEMGVSTGENPIVVVIDGGDEQAARETLCDDIDPEPTLEPDEETLCSYFDISDVEREATTADLEALVCERVALLAVDK